MRNSYRPAIIAAISAAALAASGVGAGGAATVSYNPAESHVPATAIPHGDRITITFVNRIPSDFAPLRCAWELQQVSDKEFPDVVFEGQTDFYVHPGATYDSTSRPLEPGEYALSWRCIAWRVQDETRDFSGPYVWGTPEFIDYFSDVYVKLPTPTVYATVDKSSSGPEPICLGSICLR